MVDVVQLVENRIVVPSVVGSSPIIHPKRSWKAVESTPGVFFYASFPSFCDVICD